MKNLLTPTPENAKEKLRSIKRTAWDGTAECIWLLYLKMTSKYVCNYFIWKVLITCASFSPFGPLDPPRDMQMQCGKSSRVKF